MAKGGGDVVLGGRHLAGIFVLLVVVMGMVFTLGYLLGRSRTEEQPRAAAGATAGSESAASTAPAPGPLPGATPSDAAKESGARTDVPPASWDFYRSGESPKTAELAPPAGGGAAGAAPKASVPSAKPTEISSEKSTAAAARAEPARPAPSSSALIPKGAITLQVMASVQESDALALAQALQEKKFPAIVTTPSTDKYYRVQIGPYPDIKSATAARRELEKEGFKSIVRK